MGHQLSEGGVQKERTATNSFNSSMMFHSFRIKSDIIVLSCLFRRSPKTTNDDNEVTKTTTTTADSPHSGVSGGTAMAHHAGRSHLIRTFWWRALEGGCSICEVERKDGTRWTVGRSKKRLCEVEHGWKMDGTWMKMAIFESRWFQWCVWSYSKNGDFPEHTVSLLG